MKSTLAIFALALSGSILNAQALLTIPGDGSDGNFNPTQDVVIDLGQAATNIWSTVSNGKGIYDSDKWAVVFKFNSVNIPAGVKVTFKNHPTYAPVVWLVQGNVTINGTLSLKGQDGIKNDTVAALTPTEPGPGGFRGGPRGPSGYGGGYGPGAAADANGSATYASSYGNPQIIPLIGGSGTGNGNTGPGGFTYGAGGGGAILIAAAGTVSVAGLVDAGGGDAYPFYSGATSGGAVRVIAQQVSGAGAISALSDGRIRIETPTLAATLRTSPETIAVAPASPPVIWPASNAPKARVLSVAAATAPLDPRAPLIAAADIAIQSNNAVDILIETRDFPIEGLVELNITPKFGGRTTLPATRISGSSTLASWRVQTILPQGFVTLQARATQP